MLCGRPLLLALAGTALTFASGAAADPADNRFTAVSTPSHVQPAPDSAAYTITLKNDPAPSGEADRGRIIPPSGFVVVNPSVAVTGCALGADWDADVLLDGTILLTRGVGGSVNNLCPGGSLAVGFSATAAVLDGPYTWGVELSRGTDQMFTLHDAKLTVNVDGTPPTTTIDSGRPPSPTNQTGASFSFSSNETEVRFECRLDLPSSPPPAFSPCTSPAIYSGLSAGGHTFAVRATDPAGNTDPTPATHSWTIDLTAPETTIQSGPSPSTSLTSATFTFSSEAGAAFECRLDGGAFGGCTSPKIYTGLHEGTHTFAVRATDSAGNTDPSPAIRPWTIDLIGPPTTILTGPPGSTNSRSAGFTFSSETGAKFECSLDGALFSACPAGYDNLSDGPHVFAVRAIDAANNTGPASSYAWTVDTRPPTATVAAGPAALSNSRSATFALSADEPSSLQCRLDGGGFHPCSSPTSYQGLGDGTHTFVVTPTDAVGNTGASSSHTWTIDATAPETTITSRPRSGTTTVPATFRFAANEPVSFECKLDGAAFAPCASPKSYARLRRSQHTFSVRSIDVAGNVDASPAAHRWAIGAAPRTAKRTSALLAPLPEARVSSPPLLRWRPNARASYYNVQVFRGRVKVLSAWPTRPSLRLRSRWTYLGRQWKLSAGTYRWYVWPAYRHDRYGRLLGQSTFIVRAK